MQIHGLQKTTLLDYPTKVAATVFLGNCNFRCPFCHNMNLVKHPEEEPVIPEEEFFSFLQSRKGILDGVCITGGEPTLQKDLPSFISRIKSMGFLVKLDTNGSNPTMLKELVDNNLPDYVAMDIKTSPSHYAEVCGLSSFDFAPISESMEFLKNGSLPYEFRTTVIKEYHDTFIMEEIGALIHGAKAYYLQSFVDSDYVENHNLHACDKTELLSFLKVLGPHADLVALRGVD